MEESNQSQKAGNNSKQVMVGTMVVNNGLTEQQVKVMIENEISNVLKDNQLIAEETAKQRLNEFGDVLLPKLIKAEMLDAFKEPAVQVLLKNVEKTAICSTRKLDYEILSELLIHRAKKTDISRNAAISNAIEIVDRITEDGLCVLTLYHAVNTFVPQSGNINEGLSVLNNLFGKIIFNKKLPTNSDWLDNLEINRLIAINSLVSTKKLNDIWFETFKSYSKLWIKNNSEELKQIYSDFKMNNIPLDLIIDNPLDNNFKTMAILNKNQVNELEIIQLINGQNIIKQVNKEQKNIIESIFNNEKFIHNGNSNEKQLFDEKLNEFANLKKLNDWWNSNICEISIRVNSVGRVIAHTNVKNIDPRLPDLD